MSSGGGKSGFASQRPWHMNVLARMDQKARIPNGLIVVKELGERLQMKWVSTSQRLVISNELSRMICEGGYEQSVARYFSRLQRRLFEQLSWYVVWLEQMDTYARSKYSIQQLIEAGEDLRCSEMQERERGRIVYELDRMLEAESEEYAENATKYLRMLRQQIAGA